jgi:hypothetical protein
MVVRRLARRKDTFFTGALFSIEGWAGDGPGRLRVRNGLGPEWDDLNYRIEHREELLDKVFDLAPTEGCAGVKHHLSGAAEVTETIIADPSIAVILLTRLNFLACYSSTKLVALKQQQAAAKTATPVKAVFVPEEFAQFVRIRNRIDERWRSRIAAAAGGCLDIDYEEARTARGEARIVQYLGLDDSYSQSAPTLKRNSDDIVGRFENPSEATQFLLENNLTHWASEGQL